MTTTVSGFERIKDEYKLCPDFSSVYALLKDNMTREVNGHILQDGYVLLGQKIVYSTNLFSRISCFR